MGRGFEPLRGHQKPPFKGGFFYFPHPLPHTKGTVLSVCYKERVDTVLWINTGGTETKKHKKQPFGDAKRIKTARRFTTKNPVGTWYFTSAHNCSIILDINNLSRTRSIASLPCKIVWEIWHNLLPVNHFIIRLFFMFLFLIPFTIRHLRCPTLRPINFPELFFWIKPPYNAIICFECEVGVRICIKIH